MDTSSVIYHTITIPKKYKPGDIFKTEMGSHIVPPIHEMTICFDGCFLAKVPIKRELHEQLMLEIQKEAEAEAHRILQEFENQTDSSASLPYDDI